MIIGKEKLNNFDDGVQKEWLVTNGLGGFASSTVIGCNTRKYHGLLFSSLDKKDSRYLLVSKLNEVLHINGQDIDLSTNECIDYISHGYKYQTEFEYDKLPKFTYKIDDNVISKEICMVHLENTTVIKYDITTGINNISIDFMPLVNEADEKMPKIYPILLEEKCPNCGSPLVMRNGKYGEFQACSAFPKCRYIKPKEIEETKKTNIKCPNCEKGYIVERISKRGPSKGKSFYACDQYPKCKTTYSSIEEINRIGE